MISHLYRFRPIARLLDRELENQEVFFAAPEKLNDPMEGFRDIFWKGDEVVWSNLLRNYILCLERAFALLVFCREDQSFGWDQIPVFNYGETSVTPAHRLKQDEILEVFFCENGIKYFVRALAARSMPIRGDELAAHLRGIHLFALSIIRHCYEKENPALDQRIDPAVLEKLKGGLPHVSKAIDSLRELEQTIPINDLQIDTVYAMQQRRVAELDFINLYNEAIDPKLNNRNFVFITFCGEYVKKLETLVYPNRYAACFMADCRSSSVWGTYGEKHTAACLKFKVDGDAAGPSIQLKRQNGFAGDGPIYGQMRHSFHEIQYESNHQPIDFFRSLRLPIPTLKRYRYADRTGNRSPCGDDIFKNDKEWRDRYWAGFYHAIVRKLKDWEYEKEYRLILSGEMLDFSTDESRKTVYDFNDLDGIIFGIKTELKDKLAICKIIERKCREIGRHDFKFYQAFYSRSTGEIDHAEMPWLKFGHKKQAD